MPVSARANLLQHCKATLYVALYCYCWGLWRHPRILILYAPRHYCLLLKIRASFKNELKGCLVSPMGGIWMILYEFIKNDRFSMKIYYIWRLCWLPSYWCWRSHQKNLIQWTSHPFRRSILRIGIRDTWTSITTKLICITSFSLRKEIQLKILFYSGSMEDQDALLYSEHSMSMDHSY